MAARESKTEKLLHLYERMQLVRQTETKLRDLFNDGLIPGFIHLSIGQEAVAVGVADSLRQDDTVASTHRGHGHGIAKGMDPTSLLNEIRGNVEGVCKGRGGSLHVADFSVGMLGANGIVAGGIPIALGSALAHKTLDTSRVAVVFFGDGALAEGVLYESLNMAALMGLPLLFVCENNGWSEFSPTSSQYVGTLEKLAGTFNVSFQKVDGNDVEAVSIASNALVEQIRAGKGPGVLECVTHRLKGHYEGDPQVYRKDLEEPEFSDPLEVVKGRLGSSKSVVSQIEAIDKRVAEQVAMASQTAAQGTPPDFSEAINNVYA